MEGEKGYMKEVDNFISSLRLGEPDSFGNLTVFPLYSEYSRVDGYTLRSKKSKSVHENLMARCSYSSDQNEIWNDIREKAMRFSVSSDKESMNDIYKSYDKKIEEYETAFRLHPEQVGCIALIDQRVVGSDIFGLKSVLPKVYS